MGVVTFPSEGTIGSSFLPKRYDITVYQGDTFKFKTVFNQPPVDPETTGLPVDITGWTGLCQVKDDTNQQLISATVTVTNPTGGEVEVDFGDTSLVPGGEYKYDLEMTDSGLNKRTFIGGKFIVVEDITE
jgi:hypothetical protein